MKDPVMTSSALERLRAARMKKTGAGPSSSHQPAKVSNTQWPELDKSPEASNKLVIKRWYDTIIQDQSRAPEALNFYRVAVENAYQHATAVGNLL